MHRIDHPTADTTTVPGKSLFTEGNPGLGVPATFVTDDFMNEVQEEIISVLAAASIVPAKGTINQLLAALNALYAPLNVATPPQFDDDTSLATTEFVQRALGNKRGYVGLTANTSLTAAHVGHALYASSSSGAITLTLPAANSLKAGATYKIYNTGVDNVIVSRAGSDTILLGTTSNTVTSITLGAGDWIEITSLGTGALWYHSGGTAQLVRSTLFGSSIGGSGWQRLPSGLIFQWGVYSTSASNTASVTFPITFPTNVRSIGAFNPTATIFATTSSATASGMNVVLSASATTSGQYFVIGN
jgi:hypothetical protein